MEERRRYPRYKCLQIREFLVRHKESIIGRVRDFSRSGISFDSSERLYERGELDIDLQILGIDQKIPADVKIIWSQLKSGIYTYGATIRKMLPEDKFRILDLLYQDWKKEFKA